ncbi:hypothetical protein BH23CYA1_BH23CYA1_00110 [soil metagenome]
MEPITWAVLLTLVATKATEKIGEQLGEGAISSAKHLLEVLRRRSPETAQRLALTSGAPDGDVIEAEIIEEVMRVAAADPEVQAAVEATAAAVAADPQGLKNLTKLADKIGVVNLGTVQSQINNITL